MNIQMINREDSNFPKCFGQLLQKPSVLYYKGDISLLDKDSVALIGMRDASETALKTAREYGRCLSEENIVVVNGIARGVDQAAIKGVIDGKGKAILVMPCGLDSIYPASAKDMVQAVLQLGGCIISEYREGTNPQKYNFLQRDRLQAAIANKVVVVSAEENGGTMTTVNYTLGLHKPVACVSNNDSGNRKLIDSHKSRGLLNKNELISFVNESEPVQLSFAF